MEVSKVKKVLGPMIVMVGCFALVITLVGFLVTLLFEYKKPIGSENYGYYLKWF